MDNAGVQLIALLRIISPGDSVATNQTHELKMVSTGDTVEQLKIKIEEAFGYKASHQQLTYRNDIMDNEERLLHYKVENNTFNYVEMYVYMLDEPTRTFGKSNSDNKESDKNNKPKKKLWQKVKEETFKDSKKAIVDPYIPQKQDERLWIPVSGYLPIKPPTRRAMVEGTKGVLRFMDEYKSHAGVQQECCFGLITLAQRTEEALLFKERLINEGVVARVTTALARFSSHYGLQKQGLGVLHYLLFDKNSDCIFAIIQRKGVALSVKALEKSVSELQRLNKRDRIESTGITCCDIIEFSLQILIICCGFTLNAYTEAKDSDIEKIINDAKPAIEGCLQEDRCALLIAKLLKIMKSKPPKEKTQKKRKK
eukprot:g1605.t1